MTIAPDLFMVRIDKEAQRNFKEKLSNGSPFFIPVGTVFQSRNMEHGEIVEIGSEICEKFGWEKCKVGYTLIFHWTVEAPARQHDRKAQYFLYEDETYNYYAVNEINVRGYYDGKTVVPNPRYIFLKNKPAFPWTGEIDERTGNKISKTKGGILLVEEWKDSPQDIAGRSLKIKEHIDSLAKSTRTPEIQREMEGLDAEMKMLNRKSQKSMFLPFLVAFSSPAVDRNFSRPLQEDDVLYCLNKGCLYISNFQLSDCQYIIAPIEYIGALK